jgi:Glycosyltransferase like family
MSKSHASISVICVYNKPFVREQCLDRSIEALSSESDDVEYIPIDNVSRAYPSAGAALNHGVSLAKMDVMVFAHQDVYLHSLKALKKAADQLQTEEFGVVGAIGPGANGRLIGRIRDRVVLAGDQADRLTEVDSLDEVLFMAPRGQLLSEPLTESLDFAWHCYAVEYGLRMQRKGLRTGVADIPLTHNSLSVNLEGLDTAHQAVARSYTELLPVRTTCGTITSKIAGKNRHDWFAPHRSRYRWLRDSIVLQGTRSAADGMAAVLLDLRTHIDGAIERAPGRQLYIVNRSTGSPFVMDRKKPIELTRGTGTAVFADSDIYEIPGAVANRPPGAWTLITNLSKPDIKFLEKQMVLASSILGFHHATGFWLLLRPRLAELPESWRSRRATPLGVSLTRWPRRTQIGYCRT